MTPADAARRLVRSRFLRRLAAVLGDGTYLVGGALRDRLLSIPTHDVDLVVEHDPAGAAQRLAAAFGGRAFPLGRPPLVTWRVAAGARHFDIWQIERSLAADIWRRDLTVNALFWRLPRGPLLDPTGGLDDLAARRLRVVRRQQPRRRPAAGAARRAPHEHPPHPCHDLRDRAPRRRRGSRPGHRRPRARHRGAAAPPRRTRRRQGPCGGRAPRRPRRPVPGLGALARPRRDFQPGQRARRPPGPLPGASCARAPRLVAPALLAAPAAGFPASWDMPPRPPALERIGYPARAAAAAARAAGLGEELARAGTPVGGHPGPGLRGGRLLPAVLAWAAAGDPAWLARAPGIWRWQRAFDRRPPLLGGEQIVALLALPPGPGRAEAVRVLRRCRGPPGGPQPQAGRGGSCRSWRGADRWLALIPLPANARLAAMEGQLSLDDLLKFMTKKGASDLHLKPMRPPLLRIRRQPHSRSSRCRSSRRRSRRWSWRC